MSTLLDPAVLQAVADLERIQVDHPVLRRSELIARGIDDSLCTAMIRRGGLTRLRHGIYALSHLAATTDPVERHRLDLAAAIASARDPVWAFGASAALTRSMPLPFAVPSELGLVRGSGLDERSLRQPSRHRLVIPDARIVTGPVPELSDDVVRGVRVVAPALAALSAAAALTSRRWQTALFDAALWQGATLDELTTLIDQWRHLGGRDRLLVSLGRARMGAQTVLETLSRLALVEQGLPEPILQHAFHDEEGLIGYVDMWWPELNVIGEADGAIKYESKADLLKEKHREDRLRARGPAVVRWDLRSIQEAPQVVAERIRRASRWAA